eukprot:jgi/Mesen1/2375/ME000156S01519
MDSHGFSSWRQGAHIGQALGALAQGAAHKVITVCEGRERTGSQMVREVYALSRGLRREGIMVGDRVAIAALNSEWYVDWLLAVPIAGAIIAPLNYRWSVEEAAAAIRQVAPVALVVDSLCLPWWPALRQMCPSLRLAILMSSTQPGECEPLTSPLSPPPGTLPAAVKSMASIVHAGWVPGPRDACELELHHEPSGVALICFTSGTTGAPKGAALSHTALVTQSLAKVAAVGYSNRDVYLHLAPLCHIGGISSALAMVMACGRHVFAARYDADVAISHMRAHRVTALIAVPAMLADLVASCQAHRKGGHDGGPFGSVTTLLIGGGGVPPPLLRDVESLFPSARLLSAYGMTEAASSVTFSLIRDTPSQPPPPGGASSSSGRWLATDGDDDDDDDDNGDDGGGDNGSSHHKTSAGGRERGAPHKGLYHQGPGRELQVEQGRGQGQGQVRGRGSCDAGKGGSGSGRRTKRGGVCVGRPAPHVEIHIRPLEGAGEGKGEGEGEGEREEEEEEEWEGEIFTRGPHVLAGYWGQQEETRRVLDAHGWLRTGDLGWIDAHGRLWLRGRRKDMVKSGGENVHASEVEGMLQTHPGVSAAAVVGLPDARLGERVAALVVLSDAHLRGGSREGCARGGSETDSTATPSGMPRTGASDEGGKNKLVSEQLLQEHCRQRGLSRYKVPRVIVVHVGQLPVTSTGKVQKEEVKKLVMAAELRAMAAAGDRKSARDAKARL